MSGRPWAPTAAPPAKPPLADNWYAIEWQPDGVLRIWEPHVSRLLRANMFLVFGRDRHLLVDAGMGVKPLRPVLGSLLDRPVTLFVSHAHVDHVGAAAEFAEDVLIHEAEAPVLANPPAEWALTYEAYPEAKKARLRAAGFGTEGALIAALPEPSFDPTAWRVPPCAATKTVDEGDVVDLGDRRLSVLHVPGHTPGSVALFEEATGALFAGDAIYDGLIIDTLPESDPTAYRGTMARLRDLDARIVHGGHRESFGPDKLEAIATAYLGG